AVTVAVAILVDPVERSPGFRFEFPDQVVPSCPTFKFIQQDQEERSCIRCSKVRRVWPLFERGHFAVTGFVQNLSGLFITKIVKPCALSDCKNPQGGCRQFRYEG